MPSAPAPLPKSTTSLPASPSFEPTYSPCIVARGKTPAKILILGEAPGEQEEKKGVPFIGPSGRELSRMLEEAGLDESQIFLTNVLQTRPPGNDLSKLCLPSAQKNLLPSEYTLPPLKLQNKVHYIHPNLLPEFTRLGRELERCQPNLILALGNTALWAMTGRQNISSVRGTVLDGNGWKVLPTYHPAAVLRSWDLRPIVVADLMKAKRQSLFPEVRRPSRKITIDPTLKDLEEFYDALGEAQVLAVDVETRLGQITEIGFAPSPSSALVVPFVRGFKENYWHTTEQEAAALAVVRQILTHSVPKVFQNGLYDIQYIWRTWHIAPRNCSEDTMLHHHALYPELQKGLGFLGSVYTDEPAWKLMRAKGSTQEKRDDE